MAQLKYLTIHRHTSGVTQRGSQNNRRIDFN